MLSERERLGREEALAQKAFSAWYSTYCHHQHLCLLQLVLVGPTAIAKQWKVLYLALMTLQHACYST